MSPASRQAINYVYGFQQCSGTCSLDCHRGCVDPDYLYLQTFVLRRAAVKIRALVDEKSRPYFTNEAIGISIKTQDSICVNLGLYTIRKIIGFSSELVVSVFRDPIMLTDGQSENNDPPSFLYGDTGDSSEHENSGLGHHFLVRVCASADV